MQTKNNKKSEMAYLILSELVNNFGKNKVINVLYNIESEGQNKMKLILKKLFNSKNKKIKKKALLDISYEFSNNNINNNKKNYNSKNKKRNIYLNKKKEKSNNNNNSTEDNKKLNKKLLEEYLNKNKNIRIDSSKKSKNKIYYITDDTGLEWKFYIDYYNFEQNYRIKCADFTCKGKAYLIDPKSHCFKIIEKHSKDYFSHDYIIKQKNYEIKINHFITKLNNNNNNNNNGINNNNNNNNLINSNLNIDLLNKTENNIKIEDDIKYIKNSDDEYDKKDLSIRNEHLILTDENLSLKSDDGLQNFSSNNNFNVQENINLRNNDSNYSMEFIQ